MKDRPDGVSQPELEQALTSGWGIQPDVLTYLPEGAGSYHWMAQDHRGGVVGFARGGLWFVAAPVPAGDGETVWPVNSRYAVAVYPYILGVTGKFGQPLNAYARADLLVMLAALHQVVPTSPGPVADPQLGLRDALEAALGQLDQPWTGGPFSELARLLLAGSASPIRTLLGRFDRRADQLAAAPDQVITHGEPHPANLMVTGDGPLLIDWDTVGVARPERDLWWVLGPSGATGDEGRRYTEATGRPIAVPPAAADAPALTRRRPLCAMRRR